MRIVWLLIGAVALDLIIGDPAWIPHPIRGIGWLIAKGEKLLRALFPTRLRLAGKILAVGVPLITLLISWVLLWILYRIHPLLGFAAELLLASLTLAAKSLKTESMKVYAELQKGDLEGARHAVSMIVGRDTEVLDQTGVTKAAVETVAENTSDGVIAPMSTWRSAARRWPCATRR